jgi:hypothetical protein
MVTAIAATPLSTGTGGLVETPVLADGHRSALLAPNWPVQERRTAKFWNRTYPEVRKGRRIKHAEDPWTPPGAPAAPV